MSDILTQLRSLRDEMVDAGDLAKSEVVSDAAVEIGKMQGALTGIERCRLCKELGDLIQAAISGFAARNPKVLTEYEIRGILLLLGERMARGFDDVRTETRAAAESAAKGAK